jgi:hypothetical protein
VEEGHLETVSCISYILVDNARAIVEWKAMKLGGRTSSKIQQCCPTEHGVETAPAWWRKCVGAKALAGMFG